jgi:F-type H+-transporting ATPase subunit delta
MSQTTIANRYSRALVDVIIERRETNEVIAELNDFSTMMNGHEQLREVFSSPVISLERKQAVLQDLLSRLKLRPLSANFLQLLLANSRIHNLDMILEAVSSELDARTNVVSAVVTTAREIADHEKSLLREKLKAATGKDVRLSFSVDPAIIGGVVTRIGGVVYDGSIKNQLSQMKQKLMNANL